MCWFGDEVPSVCIGRDSSRLGWGKSSVHWHRHQTGTRQCEQRGDVLGTIRQEDGDAITAVEA
jgi:hypothetical protein